ncbi:MAG: TRAP transporter small permease [Betaproteobacteria bacterium]|nr:TRAP transporter small permease [Betaproteobacteria bacterium]
MKVLDHLEEWIIALLMGSATTIIFVAVAHRYASGVPIPGLQDKLLAINLSWAQELCIYMFVWMAKFGAAYGVRTGIHVGVDVFINMLGPRKRAAFVLFGLLAGALFTGIVASMGAHFVWEIAHTDQVSPDLEVPAWIPYLAIPLGSSLMCFRFLQVAWSFFRTGELPHHDHGHVEGVEKVDIADIVPVAIVPDLHPKEVLPKGHPRRKD